MFDEGGSRVMLRKVLVGAPARKILSVLPWLVLSGALFGQGNSGNAPGGGPANNGYRVPLPQDGSDHTVVYSKPADPGKASELSRDPRYLKQWYGRNLAGSRNANVANPAAVNGGNGTGKKNPPPPPPGTPQGDWNYSLGGSSSSRVATSMFPAKYNFDINQAPSCTEDFVVFAENVTANHSSVAASQTGTFSSTGASSGTITLNGTALTASPATAASQTGSFSAPPLSSGSITITNGANTLTLTNNGSGSNATGTWSAAPASNTSISVTSGSNTLAMTTNATPGSVIGTFSAPPTPGGSITITDSSGASPNTLTLTNSGTGANATGTFSAPPASNTSVSITSGSNTLTLTTNATTTVTTVQFNGKADGSQASTGIITLTNGSNSLVITAVSSGSNGCTNSTTGTFVNGTNATEANNLRDAINSCNTNFGAVGFTATSNGIDTTTITAVKPGATTVAKTLNHTSLTTTAGINGTNTCSSATSRTL